MHLQTHFAPAERASGPALKTDIGLITNNPLVDALMSTSQGLFAVLNDQRQILSLNRTFLDLMGIDNIETALGLRPGEYVKCIHASEMPGGCGTSRHCADCGAVIALLAALDSDEPQAGTCELSVNRDQQQVDIAFQIKCCRTIIDGESFLLLFLQDITPLKQQAYEELQSIIATAHDGFMSIDAQGNILDVNQSCCAMTGYARHELLGMTIEELGLDLGSGTTITRLEEIKRNGSACFEARQCRKDGSVLVVEASVTCSTVQEGQFYSFIRDITERKRAEEKLHEQAIQLEDEIAERQKAQEELYATNATLEASIKAAVAELRQKDNLLIHQNRLAAMGELLTTISHQWRQPLNNAAAYLQTMQCLHHSGELTHEEMDRDIASTLAILWEMSQTIDDFRTFFKKDSEMQRFVLWDAVERCIKLVSSTMQAGNIVVKITGDAQLQAEGYPNEFAQSIVNILYNARDVLLERAVADPQIEVSITRDGSVSIVNIRDNGGGISPDIMPYIFEPYFSTKGPATGTGIGLYMARTLIEHNMGGRLTVRNSEGGAEFRIEL